MILSLSICRVQHTRINSPVDVTSIVKEERDSMPQITSTIIFEQNYEAAILRNLGSLECNKMWISIIK